MTIARKTMRVLVFLNDACTRFLQNFVDDDDDDSTTAPQLEAALEVTQPTC